MDQTPEIDVVFSQPPRKPFEAMPAGGGDLVAMVRVAGAVELHLGKCDSWGFRDWHDRIHATELLSPGHVTIHFDPDPAEHGTLLEFEQRLSPARGTVEAAIVTRAGELRVAVWGDMARNVLVVEIEDSRSDRGATEVELSHWRNEPSCQIHGEYVLSEEIQDSSVLRDSQSGLADPYLGRGIGLAVATDVSCQPRWWGRENASLVIPPGGPTRYRILVACEVVAPRPAAEREGLSALYYRGGQWKPDSGSATGRALATLQAALAVPPPTLRAGHDDWWRTFWSTSTVRLTGDDDALRLTRLWHLFHYQMAISSRGAYPTHFNGGPGIFERDLRSWQLIGVWQNDREHLWPLDAANHPELTNNVWRMYGAMVPYLRRLTRESWGIDGVWLPEAHEPWWDSLLPADAAPTEARGPWAGGLGRDQAGSYGAHIFSSGPELVQQTLDHARHTGDEAFLRDVACPLLAGVCEFYAGWASLGDDGLYHWEPANANEMWWKVKDTLNDLCAVRVLFPELVALSARYGRDRELAARCREILLALPDLPVGQWRVVEEVHGKRIEVDRSVDAYAPARDALGQTQSFNQENPECYVIFPWSLTGISAEDLPRASRTFALRGFHNTAGWSQCGVQAARLGLRDQAADTIMDHARRQQLFPCGGWNSPGAMPYRLPDGSRLGDCPYLDAAGENATAVQEMLLQSYPSRGADDAAIFARTGSARVGVAPYGSLEGGVIRLCPAAPERWSGTFTLHAMGGFLVSCDFASGVPERARVRSERGNRCVVAGPWPSGAVLEGLTGERRVVTGELISFRTLPGGEYTLTPAGRAQGQGPPKER